MITRTVGVGGDFASPEAAVAAYNGVDMVEDLTFDQISDVTCAANMILTILHPMQYTIRWTSSYNEAHPKDWQNWYKISVEGAGVFGLNSGNNAKTFDGRFDIGHFYVIDNRAGYGTGIVDAVMWIQYSDWVFNNRWGNVDVHNGYIDERARGAVAFYFPVQQLIRCNIWDMKIWDTVKNAPAPEVNSAGIYLERGAALPNYTPRVENVTLFNSYLEMESAPLIGKNIVAYNNSVVAGKRDFVTNWATDNDIQNCADTDGSIDTEFPGQNTKTKTGIVPADEFRSLDDTDFEFLKLKYGEAEMVITATPKRGRAPLPVKFTADVEYRTGGILGQAGTEPENPTTDITGLALPDDGGFYAIGCHQQQYEWITPPLEG